MARFSFLLLALLATGPVLAQPTPDALALIPAPVSVTATGGAPFVLTGATRIRVDSEDEAALRIGQMLDALVGPTYTEIMGLPGADPEPVPTGVVRLQTGRDDLGPEGYALEVTAERVTITAPTAAGLFYGVQTLRQLMPPWVEYGAEIPRPIPIPAVRIEDRPRFAWRGAMLDVARHFFGVEDVTRYLDLMALYKLNRLHLHLSDDQGWRIEIPSYPALTEVGGSTEVGGGPGGFYTTEDYAEIVRYAAERFITIVPEIDLPGHTNAALASVPELNCDGEARPLYTGIRVGFSHVCVEKEATYAFVDAVVGALAASTPGPVVHIGGDEVHELAPDQYAHFMTRAQAIVAAHGKQVAAWDEVAAVDLDLAPGTIVQVWRPQSPATAAHVADAVAQGAQLVLSPAEHVYVDMKYDSTTVLGLMWAGPSSVRDAYEWEPGAFVAGVPAEAVLGVEAPLWSETLRTIRDVEFMAFPRLAGVAEVAWSPEAQRGWAGYRLRLAAHGSRWTALGVNFYRSPEVPWPSVGEASRAGEARETSLARRSCRPDHGDPFSRSHASAPRFASRSPRHDHGDGPVRCRSVRAARAHVERRHDQVRPVRPRELRPGGGLPARDGAPRERRARERGGHRQPPQHRCPRPRHDVGGTGPAGGAPGIRLRPAGALRPLVPVERRARPGRLRLHQHPTHDARDPGLRSRPSIPSISTASTSSGSRWADTARGTLSRGWRVGLRRPPP